MPKQLKTLWLLLVLGAIAGVTGEPISRFLHHLFDGGFIFFVNMMVIICVSLFVIALGLGLYYVNREMINEIQFAIFFVASFILGGMILFWVVFVLL
ncbi:hypothetical protein ACDX78_21690 [Virgibacillus oceani]